jgi:hypothetical protein
MADEKRMAGNYEITHSIHIGDNEIVMGEDLNNKDGHFYMVADCKQFDIFNNYENCFVGNDFTELAEIFAQRLTEQVQKLKEEQEKLPVKTEFITKDMCVPLELGENIRDKIIVIKPEVLRAENRLSVKQLYFATGGNGTHGNSRGTAVFCTSLYNKQDTRFERYDVMGTMEPEQLPEWAKENFEEMTEHKEKMRQFRDVKFVEEQYGEITADKFFRTDSGITEVYYNPDANSGGQLVYIEASDNIIREAAQKSKKPEDFFSYIEGAGRGYLIDVGTSGFRGNFESFQ